MTIEVACIDDSNKPSQIADGNWIKLHKMYTVIGAFKHITTGELAFELAEVRPNAPYKGYKASRFVPIDEIRLSEVEEILEKQGLVKYE